MDLFLVFITALGKNSDSKYVYEFYLSDDPDMFWITDADIKPASICNIGIPDRMTYDEVIKIETDILLSLVQKNPCFSIQDCKDGILPVAWENIDSYDEYPSDGRLVLPFGLPKEEMLNKLEKKNMIIK